MSHHKGLHEECENKVFQTNEKVIYARGVDTSKICTGKIVYILHLIHIICRNSFTDTEVLAS